MTVRVQDYKGNEIKVGDHCVYGAPPKFGEYDEHDGRTYEDYIVEITEISEPDVYYNPVTDADDGGYGVKIKFAFPDGQTDEVDAMFDTQASRDNSEIDGTVLEVFEEGGDLELLPRGTMIEVNEDGTWHFLERLASGKLRTFLTVKITEIVTQSDSEQPSCDIYVKVYNAPTKESTVEDASLRVFFSGD